MTAAPPPSLADVNQAELKTRGFTESGARQYSSTVIDYATRLFDNATHLGEATKAPNMPAEIGHDHVRSAALLIARSFGAPTRSGWSVVGQVGEYLATAAAGVGGGHLDKAPGIISFGVGVSVAVILVVARLATAKGE